MAGKGEAGAGTGLPTAGIKRGGGESDEERMEREPPQALSGCQEGLEKEKTPQKEVIKDGEKVDAKSNQAPWEG